MLELYFITSNATKLAHYAYIGRLFGVKILGFRQRTYYGSYVEPDSEQREEVIMKSYESALDKWHRAGLPASAMFFFEDTSVRIDALSEPAQDVPGTRIKFWMREHSLDALNALLGRRTRKATVRSDLVLHLPEGLRAYLATKAKYLTFTGEVRGAVARQASTSSSPNALYPWLDSMSFSGWFKPAGADTLLSDMTIREADKFDFRLMGFKKLLDFFRSVRLYATSESQRQIQRTFPFAERRKLVVFLGRTCAGKTTAARHLSDRGQAVHLEASDFMRAEFVRRHGTQTALHVRDFAAAALREQPWIVPEQIFAIINKFDTINFVVSGLRSPDELHLLSNLVADVDLRLIWIDAKQRVRFARSSARARAGAPVNFAAFRDEDFIQQNMGLRKLRRATGLTRIENDKSVDLFTSRIDELLGSDSWTVSGAISDADGLLGNLEKRLIMALGSMGTEGEFFTSGLVAAFTRSASNVFAATEKDNISRFFTQASYPFFELKKRRAGTEVRLSNSGISMFRLLTFAQSNSFDAGASSVGEAVSMPLFKRGGRR